MRLHLIFSWRKDSFTLPLRQWLKGRLEIGNWRLEIGDWRFEMGRVGASCYLLRAGLGSPKLVNIPATTHTAAMANTTL